MGSQTSLLIGMAVGIVTACVIFLAVYVTKYKLKPWYTKLRHRGDDLSGPWKTRIDYEGARDELTFHINQSLDEITGNIVILKKYPSGQLVNRKKISLKGRYASGYLMLVGMEDGNSESHHCTLLLKYFDSEKSLTGASAWVTSDPSGFGMTSRNLQITR